MDSKALPDQVRHFDEDRPRVATKSGDDLPREGMATVVIQIVVVACIESRSGARRPAKQSLRSQSRIECVVVENHSRKRRFSELVRHPVGQDVDFECVSIGVVAFQALVIKIERRGQLVCRLISDSSSYLKQVSATRIERRIPT